MPSMHGLTLIDILRHTLESRQIPIIVFSDGQNDVEPADGLAACEVVEKSQFSLTVLLDGIRRLLGQGESRLNPAAA